MKQLKTFIIVGAGNRANIYASYAKTHPDEMKIVGVADPNPLRRNEVKKKKNEECQIKVSAQNLCSRLKV